MSNKSVSDIIEKKGILVFAIEIATFVSHIAFSAVLMSFMVQIKGPGNAFKSFGAMFFFKIAFIASQIPRILVVFLSRTTLV